MWCGGRNGDGWDSARGLAEGRGSDTCSFGVILDLMVETEVGLFVEIFPVLLLRFRRVAKFVHSTFLQFNQLYK